MSGVGGGLPLAHRIEGLGAPVVLLNGGMMSFPAWEPVATRLVAHYQLLRCDFRGQLLSPGAPPPDLAGHARDVVALLERIGWPSAHLVGASFGGEVAIELAAAFPERARSLVLITAMDQATPEFSRHSHAMRAILAEIRAGGERGRFYDVLVESVYSPRYRQAQAAALADRRAQVAQLPPSWFEGVDGLLAALDAFDLRSRLGAVRCPAQVVLAGADRVMAPERSRALAAALGAEIAEHPSSGHALVAEDPSWLAEVVLEFLAHQEATDR